MASFGKEIQREHPHQDKINIFKKWIGIGPYELGSITGLNKADLENLILKTLILDKYLDEFKELFNAILMPKQTKQQICLAIVNYLNNCGIHFPERLMALTPNNEYNIEAAKIKKWLGIEPDEIHLIPGIVEYTVERLVVKVLRLDELLKNYKIWLNDMPISIQIKQQIKSAVVKHLKNFGAEFSESELEEE